MKSMQIIKRAESLEESMAMDSPPSAAVIHYLAETRRVD
uniref:Uncharacterized protein n=1 Tax=Nelumbo nucifera TaxID=4432 RepID=A0A822ZIN4_NELNU|nr:TPA_asm: hypothetical protein HUJ06_003222 [Nelumbo nucifera]